MQFYKVLEWVFDFSTALTLLYSAILGFFKYSFIMLRQSFKNPHLHLMLAIGFFLWHVVSFSMAAYGNKLSLSQAELSAVQHLWSKRESQNYEQLMRDIEQELSLSSKVKEEFSQLVSWFAATNFDPKTLYRNPEHVLEFREKYRHWPSYKALKIRGDLYIQSTLDTSAMQSFFEEHSPTANNAVFSYLISLPKDTSYSNVISELIQSQWTYGIDDLQEQEDFAHHFDQVLTKDMHQARLNHLLQAYRVTFARNMFSYLDPSQERVARARIALIQSHSSVDRLIARLSPEEQQDPGFLFDRIRWREKHRRTEPALALLKTVQGDVAYPKRWWSMRKRFIRLSMDRKAYQDSYLLARNHANPPGSVDFAES